MRRAGVLGAIVVLAVSSCASAHKVYFKIETQPVGAQVLLNGADICTAPCTIWVQGTERWVGLSYSPSGRACVNGRATVEVMPIAEGQYAQSRSVDACTFEPDSTQDMKFDLLLRKVAPKQEIEIHP